MGITEWKNRLPGYWTSSDYMLAIILFVLLPCIKWVPIFLLMALIFLLRDRRQLATGHFFGTLFGSNTMKWMLIFFGFHVVGMFWSEDLSAAGMNIEHKLSLLFLPIFFSLYKSNITIHQSRIIFLLGLGFSSVLLAMVASYKTFFYQDGGDFHYWIQSDFSFFMHRSYLACYMSMGALIALHAWLKNRHKYMLMGFILFTVVVVLTASKAGLITLVTGSFVLSVQWVYRYLNNWKVWLLTMLSFLLMGVLLWSNALLRMRFSSAWNSITSAEVVNNPSKDSTQARMIMWSSARSVISRNFWIGVGTGDGDMELQKENLNRNNTGVAKQKLNAHNQFLNTWVQLGVLSCLVLVAIFGSLGFYFYKKKSPISLLILFCFFINFLFESLLETRAGIVPFCFLTLLLLTIIRQESGDYTLSTE